MIRRMTPIDIPAVGAIWLEASIRAHHFVPESFWRSDHAVMTNELLPRARGWVHLDDDTHDIDGFVTVGIGTVECLFVRPDRQRRGIGTALLEHVKRQEPTLELGVYAQNTDARRFYEAQGFGTSGATTCQHTGCAELRMTWRAS